MSAEVPAPGLPQSDVFPTLTAAQIDRIAPLARERSIAEGEILWEQGDMGRPLMVVLEGEIEILSDGDAVVTVHRAGGFSATWTSLRAVRQSCERERAARGAYSSCLRNALAASS